MSLNYWSIGYSHKFIVGESNEKAWNFFHNFAENALLIGPAKSGKKHLSFLFSKKYDSFVLSQMSESLIIQTYDFYKLNEKKAIFINDTLTICQTGSADVRSRISSLIVVKIEELTLDMQEQFLISRLSTYGINLNEYLLKYCLLRLNCSYAAIEDFVSYLKHQPSLNMFVIAKYFL